MGLPGGCVCRKSDTDKHQKGALTFINPGILDAFEAKWFGFENRYRLASIQLLDALTNQPGYTPTPIRRIDIAGEVMPTTALIFAQRATLDRSAVEFVFGDRPDVVPFFQVCGSRNSRLAAAIRLYPARTANAVSQIPGLFVRLMERSWRARPITGLKADRFADNYRILKQVFYRFMRSRSRRAWFPGTLPCLRCRVRGPSRFVSRLRRAPGWL